MARNYLSLLSGKQKTIFVVTILLCVAIAVSGIFLADVTEVAQEELIITNDMSMKQVAPLLETTGYNLAKEFGLSLDSPKNVPLSELGVSQEELDEVAHHLLGHIPSNQKYFIYLAIVLFGFVFMNWLGRPANASVDQKSVWYPRLPYILALFSAVIFAGFVLGKSPNPMEGIVKVFKAMVGLYPSVAFQVGVFVFFVVLAIIGAKLICGWGCPYGALQELIYSIPILKKVKEKRVPFVFSNAVRKIMFLVTLLMLFGVVGGKRGYVLYHMFNPFNIFNLDIELVMIGVTIIVTLVLSFITYRPFCFFICPFGLVSWLAEKVAITRVNVDKKTCIDCKACAKVCPSESARAKLEKKIMGADCFSCARCLNVCPVDAIHDESVFKKRR